MDYTCICFVLGIGIVVAGAAAIAGYFLYNLSQPTRTRKAKLVSKWTAMNQPGSHQSTYHCTFEFEDGHREEFRVSPVQYGVLAEGDQGELDTKGTLFWDFRRETK